MPISSGCDVVITCDLGINGYNAGRVRSDGDFVMAFNEDTGEVSVYPVLQVHVHVDEEILHLVIDGEAIITTPIIPCGGKGNARGSA